MTIKMIWRLALCGYIGAISATTNASEVTAADPEPINPVVKPTAAAAAPQLVNASGPVAELSLRALGLLNTRYQFGGATPESGFDCSGLIRYLFRDVFGIELPRSAEQISRVGQTVEVADLQPGDLVFYNTLRRGFSHVGLYLGDMRFIHSPARGGQVRIENMETAYWKQRFDGARRISTTR